MILGYPGRTNRWMPAAGIEQNVKLLILLGLKVKNWNG
jgi:hypothetical protein